MGFVNEDARLGVEPAPLSGQQPESRLGQGSGGQAARVRIPSTAPLLTFYNYFLKLTVLFDTQTTINIDVATKAIEGPEGKSK